MYSLYRTISRFRETQIILNKVISSKISSSKLKLLEVKTDNQCYPLDNKVVCNNLFNRRFALLNAAKDNTIDIDIHMITNKNIWNKNCSGHSSIDLAFKYHNVNFLTEVKNTLGNKIEKKPFEGKIVNILEIDPDAQSIINKVNDFYYFYDYKNDKKY